ncbi:MAG: HAD family hydrolase [Clostridia bacterium]|nr:HAD family hydrolase [Clostridia bacterium]
MRTTTILFDLDGTLLPMDQDQFVKAYFGLLAKKLSPYGYDAEQLVSAIWAGTKEMIKNNGEQTNEKAFWKKFCEIFGQDAAKDEPIFAEFYENEFGKAQAVCGFNENAAKVVNLAKSKGFRVALATNPIFPAVATESRIRWAGLEPSDFELYTTYENSFYCKPNPKYYTYILQHLGVKAEECLMVGNDVTEDMIARELGMKVFLLTDCTINKTDTDISAYPHGNFEQLTKYINSL